MVEDLQVWVRFPLTHNHLKVYPLFATHPYNWHAFDLSRHCKKNPN